MIILTYLVNINHKIQGLLTVGLYAFSQDYFLFMILFRIFHDNWIRLLSKSTHRDYKTFANILEVRMLPSEYDVAMKLASLRPYKYDMSDVVGIINSEKMSRENKEEAVENLYGGFANLYDNHVILKDIDDNYPDFLSQGNLTSVLEATKRKKNSS